MYCTRLRTDDACVMAEPRTMLSAKNTAPEGSCPRAKDEVRRTKDKLRSTVAALLFASSGGATISHTCLAPLSFWRGAGGEAQCSSARCKGHSRHNFPRLTVLTTARYFNRGAQKIIHTSLPTAEAVGLCRLRPKPPIPNNQIIE